jgi:single-stranded-DNA-specific exonuclease
MSAYHLGFVLGPRINACGRLGEAALGSRILCEDDYQSAFVVAQKLCEYNDKRREIEANVLYEATIQAETLEEDLPFIFTISENWHSGVLGIVAGKLKERYQMPVFTMTVEGDIVKGSARSITQIDIGTAVISALQANLLITGGGHSMAADFL